MHNRRLQMIQDVCDKAVAVRGQHGDRYGHSLNDSKILTLLPKLLRDEKITLWSDEDPALFLKENFPEGHALWTRVTIRQTTAYNRKVEEGTYNGIVLRDNLIVITDPFKSQDQKQAKGFERLKLHLDHDWRGYHNFSVDIYRNAHDRKSWGAHHNTHTPSAPSLTTQQEFQGCYNTSLLKVVVSGLRFLVGGSIEDKDIKQAARKIIQLAKIKD